MKRMTLLTGLVAAVAITAYSVSGTYARYTSTFTGTSSARVAKWAFNLDGGETAGTTLNFKLFESVNDANVTKGINENIIAPGTEGKFQINLDATGAEVGVDYQIRFENETQKPTNLVFMYQGNNYSSIKELEENLKGTINANEEEKTKAIEVNWKWAYETGETLEEISRNDEIDTEEVQSISNYSFDIIVSGTQVVPQNS